MSLINFAAFTSLPLRRYVYFVTCFRLIIYIATYASLLFCRYLCFFPYLHFVTFSLLLFRFYL